MDSEEVPAARRRVVVKLEVALQTGALDKPSAIGHAVMRTLRDGERLPEVIHRLELGSAREQRDAAEGFTSIADLFEANVIPDGAAEVFRRAAARAKADGVEHPAQLLELLAADYLAGR